MREKSETSNYHHTKIHPLTTDGQRAPRGNPQQLRDKLNNLDNNIKITYKYEQQQQQKTRTFASTATSTNINLYIIGLLLPEYIRSYFTRSPIGFISAY